jgi:hypothetical protein
LVTASTKTDLKVTDLWQQLKVDHEEKFGKVFPGFLMMRVNRVLFTVKFYYGIQM